MKKLQVKSFYGETELTNFVNLSGISQTDILSINVVSRQTDEQGVFFIFYYSK